MVQCWKTTEIFLEAKKVTANPFLDEKVYGEFIGPNGKKLILNGFWNGDKTYIIRFTPTEAGTWSYKTYSENKDPGLKSEGEIECTPYTGDLEIYKHGFLKNNSNGNYLEYNDGTPFLWLGDTHWSFLSREEFEDSNFFLYESQFKACVDKRVEQGFNIYQCNLREGTGIGTFSPNLPLLSQTSLGLLPDIQRFEDLDRKMKYLFDKGMVVALGIAWTDDLLRNSVDRYKTLVEYITARYGSYPVIWTLSGEMPWYIPDKKDFFIREWRKVAKEIERFSPYNNLQSTHLTTATDIPEVYCGEEWFDFAMAQSGHGDYPASPLPYFNFKEKFPNIPLIESETFYEGIISRELNPRVLEADQMRKMAYFIMQAGGCGFTYGCNGIFELQWEAGDGTLNWGKMNWYNAINLPGANQLTIWKKFYTYAKWYDKKPIKITVLDSFAPTASVNKSPLFTSNSSRTEIIGYFSDVANRKCRIDDLNCSEMKGFWMDPATSHKQDISFSISNRSLTLTAPDDDSDWIIFLTNKE